ncbi:MAG: channel protein TolC [Proteobacteria bacterium]|nr:channel protein TolC [Pseudomonadota bacterium]
MKKLAMSLALLMASGTLPAADLLQIYRLAQDNDPNFAAAKATLEAGQEKGPQGLAGLLPMIGASVDRTRNEVEVTTPAGATLQPKTKYNSHGYGISLTQPLFRWQNWAAYGQSKLMVAQAEANFVQARQDLILRVSQAYFDLLYAEDNAKAVQASKKAISRHGHHYRYP